MALNSDIRDLEGKANRRVKKLLLRNKDLLVLKLFMMLLKLELRLLLDLGALML